MYYECLIKEMHMFSKEREGCSVLQVHVMPINECSMLGLWAEPTTCLIGYGPEAY